MRMATSREHGFTLIELMTALSIFMIVMTVSMGSILGIFDANRKSRNFKAVMTNLNIALEGMSREMRYGKNYHCGSSGTVTVAQNCAGGGTYLSFLDANGVQVTYRLNGTALERQEGSATFLPVTAPEAVIDSFIFYTTGAGNDNLLQPKILVAVKAHAGEKQRTDFALQTLISQRSLDI